MVQFAPVADSECSRCVSGASFPRTDFTWQGPQQYYGTLDAGIIVGLLG